MIHYFETDVAEKYGIASAVILQNLAHWISKNEANGQNFYDGYFWTYNSNKAFQELFPYMSCRQIRTALDKLVDDEIIITGCYNQSAYDRTLWYALTNKGKSICHYSNSHLSKMTNEFVRNDTPIPDNKPYNKQQIINTDIKEKIYKKESEPCNATVTLSNASEKTSRFVPPTVEEVRSYCSERNNNINAEQFVDYYESNGWKVGKNKMKDWKAAIRTWERNGYHNLQVNNTPVSKPDILDEILR